MVRVSAMLFCSIIFSANGFALPRMNVTLAKALVMVGDDSGAFVWRPTEKECREWPHWAPVDDCARFERAAAAAGNPEMAPFNSGTNQSPAQPVLPASRVKSEPGLNWSWPKPLKPQKHAALAPALLSEGLPDKHLRKMVGQLLISGFEGRTVTAPGVAEVSNALREGRIAGILVRGANITGYRQLRILLSYIRRSGQDGSAFIAIDQPGGPDAVLSEDRGFADFAAASAVGSTLPPYQAQLLYRDMAAELSSVGINFNIGPSGDVCQEVGIDLSANCFGNNLSNVTAFGRAFTYGHHDRRVLTALRRTMRQPVATAEPPSLAILHGVIRTETSDAIVVRMKTGDLLRASEMPPGSVNLKNAIQNCGPKQILVVEWDIEGDGAPLRYRDVVVRALQRGADMILIRDPGGIREDLFEMSFKAIRKSLETGDLPVTRIEAAYAHVQQLKRELGTKISQNDISP